MLNFALVVAMFVAAAAQAKHTPEERLLAPQAPNPSTAMSGPYQKLFRVKPIEISEPVRGVGQLEVHPRVIDVTPRVERGGCNMPIVVARPEIDQKMVITAPPSAQGAAKIRAIEPPPPCGRR